MKNLFRKATQVVALAIAILSSSCAGDEYLSIEKIGGESLKVEIETSDELTTVVNATFSQDALVVSYDETTEMTSDNNAYVKVELTKERVENDIEPVVTETDLDDYTSMYSIEYVKYATLADGQYVTITYGYSYIEFTDASGDKIRYPYVKITDANIGEINWESGIGEYQQDVPVLVDYVEIEQATLANIDEEYVDTSLYATKSTAITAAYTKVAETVEPEPDPEVDPEVDPDPEPEPVIDIVYEDDVYTETTNSGYFVVVTITKSEVTSLEGVVTDTKVLETSYKYLTISLTGIDGSTTFSTHTYDFVFSTEQLDEFQEPVVDGNWTTAQYNVQYYSEAYAASDKGDVTLGNTYRLKCGYITYDDGVYSKTYDYTFTPEMTWDLGDEVMDEDKGKTYRPLSTNAKGGLDDMMFDITRTFNVYEF